MHACDHDDVINDVKFWVRAKIHRKGIKMIFDWKTLFRHDLIILIILKMTCASKITLHHHQIGPQSHVTLTLHTRYDGIYTVFIV